MRPLIHNFLPASRASSWPETATIDEVARMMRGGGWTHATQVPSLAQPFEEVPPHYHGVIHGILRANPVVFGAMVLRAQVFSQARFIFRRVVDGEPQAPFGSQALGLLERPEPLIDTNALLKRTSFDHDLAGNWFGVRRPGRIKRLRPDWCWLILGTEGDIGDEFDPRDVDAEVIGLGYRPGGIYSDQPLSTFAIGEFAHFWTIPDPLVSYRGMSWLTPLFREVEADQAMTLHKLMFMRNGATPSTVVKIPPTLDRKVASELIDAFEQEHAGAFNAYRTVYLSEGWDLNVVGKDNQQLDFKAVQGASETRISVASRVPATLLGISEGLAGSALNSGNYNVAKRNFGDTTMRDMWGSMASALESIVDTPAGAELWYNERLIPFLMQDALDAADVLNKQATAMRTLWDGGADPKTVIDAVTAGDLRRVEHSGKLSVQLQPPGTGEEAAAATLEPEDTEPVEVRCSGCNRLVGKRLAEGGAFEVKCRDCGTLVAA